MSFESVIPSNHLILCQSLLLPPSIFPSIRVFSNESVLCIRWPKYWSFSFSISPSNEYSGLISFGTHWLNFHTFKGLSRVFSNTIVQKHQFFGAQLSSQSNSHIHTYSDTYNFFPTWPSFDSPHESWITGNPRQSSFPVHPFLFLFVHSVFWDVTSLGFFLLKYHLLLKSQPKIYFQVFLLLSVCSFFWCSSTIIFFLLVITSGFVWTEIQNEECGSLNYHKRRAVSWKVAPSLNY